MCLCNCAHPVLSCPPACLPLLSQSSTRSSYRARDNASQLVTHATATTAAGDPLPRSSSSSSLHTPKSSSLPEGQRFHSSLPASSSANSSPRGGGGTGQGQKAQQQSPFFSSITSFAERGKRSLGNLSGSTMASSSSSSSSVQGGSTPTSSSNNNSSPLTSIFNNLFDSKGSSSNSNSCNAEQSAGSTGNTSEAIDGTDHDNGLMLHTTTTTDTETNDEDDSVYEI